MFTSETLKHEFSRDGVKWVTPTDHSGHYGGSVHNQIPDASANGDKRNYLSFWGSEGSNGGCCHSSYSDGAKWGQAFTIIVDAPVPPPGPPMGVLMSTDGKKKLNSAYWKQKCKEVPTDATMILLEMGSVVDYYRPGKGKSWCDMFTSETLKHEFSRDGVKWVTPTDHSGHYGGSVHNQIPDASANGDKRNYLSFWGSEGSNGGCCHSSYSDGAKWGQAFTIIVDKP